MMRVNPPGGWPAPAPHPPVSPPVPQQPPGSTGKPSRYCWAWVTNLDPLRIQLDNGSADPMPITPKSIIAPTAMQWMSKVWVQLGATSTSPAVILGISGGRMPWVDVPMLNGFSERPGFTPQVLLDSNGLVNFRGQMSNGGMAGLSSDTALMALPDGYAPAAEQRWIGESTAGEPMLGYFATDGQMYVKAGSHPAPTTHWCIIVAPWEPVPVQPY